MLFTKRMLMTLGAVAGAMVVVADEVAKAEMPQSFEGAEVNAAVTTLTGWDGYGTVVATPEQRNLPAGAPLHEAKHYKHLSVEGWVTAAFDTTGDTTDRELEMLVKVAKPDEALSGMTDADAKFALAIDTDGKLNYWTGTAWAKLSETVYANDAWIRVSIVYDGTKKKCKVAVDGKIAMNGETPWFNVLNQGMTTLSSMKVVGTTAIDDVTLAKTPVTDYQPSFVGPEGEIKQAGSQVTLAWLAVNDLPAKQNVKATATDNSGLTYEQKFILGNKATDGNKFELKSISMSKSGETVQVTIRPPTFGTPAPGFAAMIQTSGDGGATWADGASVESGKDVVIDLPAGTAKVTKFRIVVKK